MEWDKFGHQVVTTLVFTVIGVAIFSLFMWGFTKLTKIPFRKEIEEDQNVALAVLLGAVAIAIALIVSAAVHG
jgi:uncharacterized membrane protein YjfL (UPF0719 family)